MVVDDYDKELDNKTHFVKCLSKAIELLKHSLFWWEVHKLSFPVFKEIPLAFVIYYKFFFIWLYKDMNDMNNNIVDWFAIQNVDGSVQDRRLH